MKKIPNHLLSNWINFWVLVFGASVLSIEGHGGESAIILLLTMIFIFLTRTDLDSKYKLNKDEIIFITLVILFWLLNIVNTIFQPLGLEFENTRMALRAIDNPMRWILMLPIYFLIRRYNLDWRFVAIGLSIGVFFTVSIAMYEVYILGNTRATGGMNHVITFGELMVAADLLLWIFMFFAWKKNQKKLALILLFSSLFAFYGSLLSVTRGAWLAYLFMIIFFAIYIIKLGLFNKKHLFSKPLLLRLFFTLILFLTVSQTEQFKTIEKRSIDAVEVLSGNSEVNASAARVDIFRTAIEIARHFPGGVGTDNFRTGGKAVIILDANNNRNIVVKNQDNLVVDYDDLDGNIHRYDWLQSFNKEDGSRIYTSRFRHAHNEWLNVLAENGLLGFILLTLVFLFPLKVFWQNLTHENELVSMYSYCGIVLVICFTIFGQTQSIFTSHAALIFFIFFLYLFFSQISILKKH
ncbi:O-antigen ligase family protein [Candidatus Pseudothioglobus singularis]|nr:O-antigen ligase family protein [Candidatus Pseudothioglobus singularis]